MCATNGIFLDAVPPKVQLETTVVKTEIPNSSSVNDTQSCKETTRKNLWWLLILAGIAGWVLHWLFKWITKKE